MRTIYRAVLLAVFVAAAVYAFAPGVLGPDAGAQPPPQRGATEAAVEPMHAPDVVVDDPPIDGADASRAGAPTGWTSDSTTPDGGFSAPFLASQLPATAGTALFPIEHSATLAGEPPSCFAPGDAGEDLDQLQGRRSSSSSS